MKKMKAESCNSHIPTDIVLENILIRVPAKSLMRFKLVCKLWQSTILHDRRFHLSHRFLSPSRPSLLAFVGTYYPLSLYKPKSVDITNWATKSVDMHDPENDQLSIENRFVCASIPSSDSTSGHWEQTVWEDYYTTEVVNGLVCFYSKNSNNNLYLCNLSTSETMKLPPSPPLSDSNNVYNHTCPYYLGFDDFNKVYKLLRIQQQDFFYDDKDNSKILTLQFNQNHNQIQDCWRNTTLKDCVGFCRSYCFRSSLYWIVDSRLICFDLNKETCTTIRYPFDPDHDDTTVRAFRELTFSMWNHHERYYDSLEVGLTQVWERLALTHSYVGATEFNIWLLDDNYKKKLYAWDKITIHIPINLRDPFSSSLMSWLSLITIPARALPGTKKIVFTIGRAMVYKPLIGFHMPIYTYDLESEMWETLDSDYAHDVVVASSSSVQSSCKKYSQIYYLHEENILPLKDILAPNLIM